MDDLLHIATVVILGVYSIVSVVVLITVMQNFTILRLELMKIPYEGYEGSEGDYRRLWRVVTTTCVLIIAVFSLFWPFVILYYSYRNKESAG